MSKRTIIVFSICSLLLVSHPGTTFAKATKILLSDDFNRPNASVVGNGWSDISALPGALSIENNKLVDTDPFGGAGGIFRQVAYRGNITLSADFSQETGNGGLTNRYQTMFSIRDGGDGAGYGVRFSRGDINYPSYIELFDAGVMVAEISSPFPYGTQMHAYIDFNQDGSVSGTISQPGDSYAFSFPARVVASIGDNVSIQMGEFYAGASNSIAPTVDNFVVSSSKSTTK